MHIHLPLVLPLLALVPQSTFASVLAIDYGTDWIKASLMKPGVPFDVLLNKDSKRKIQSSVAWKKDDRLFGGDAFNLASRFPKDSFSSIKPLLAAPYESDSTSFFAKISTADLVETSRKTVALKRSDPDRTEWSVEELVGMQFAYVKHLAEALAGEAVHDVIVTVPPFYTQFERDAVADSIEIAGLRTLALINDGTAVAVNYAMTRTFTEQPEHHIIYDAGAGSIRATIVSFSTNKDTKKVSGGTKINVAGVGYDRKIGGAELDWRLREILIEAFNSKHGVDIRTDERGMAKLWKEAGRIKAILSANADATATVESLAFDIDFKAKIKRSQLEDAAADLTDKFARPIQDALAAADMTLANITSVILTGGSTRTPMIQAAVKSLVGEDKIALNVNADEAAVLGAAFHGASLSRQFKTKNIKVTDLSLHNVQVSYHASAASATPRLIKTLLFPKGSKTGSKKTLTFKRKEDFSLFFDYENEPAAGFPKHILETEITGVSDALTNLTQAGATDPVVKATISLSESGFVSVVEAVAFGEIKDESITGKLKGLFGGGTSSAAEEDLSSAAPVREGASSTAASAASASASADAKVEKTKPVDTIPLTLSSKFASIPPLTPAEKRASRSRLRAIDAEEAAKNRKEEARNTLESYLYRIRDLLDEENRDTPFKKCSQESERKAIAAKLDELFEWIGEKGDIAETSQLLDKRNALESLERPIVHRYKEIEAFPSALNNSQMWNWSTRLFLSDARANLTAEIAADLPSKWTKEELDGLEKTLKDHEVWLNEWVEKQKLVEMNEDPVIETTEMKARAKVLETHLQRLFKRKVPKVKAKKTTTSTSTTAESTPTSESDQESATDDADADGEGDGEPQTTATSDEVPPPEATHDEL